MHVIATLTEIRKDGMQKWERPEISKERQERYLWLAPFQSDKSANVGSRAVITFQRGTGGATGSHWSLWKVTEIL